jgi:serine protease
MARAAVALATAALLCAFGVSPSVASEPSTVAPQQVEPREYVAGPEYESGQEYVAGQVLIQYENGDPPQVLDVAPDADVEALSSKIEGNPAIASATPNYIATVSGWLPNDPGLNPAKRGRAGEWQRRQWNFLPCHSLCYPAVSTGPQSRGGANVIRAWQNLRRAGRAGAKGVRIAVLDTGVAYRDLGRFRKSPELARRTFIRGFDFVERDRLPLDLNGHGTHVASTIAQTTNNRRGLTGIAYGARVMPVRVMDANGFGTTLNIIRGIRWAATNGARVINMSLNFRCGDTIPALADALRYAHRKGAVLVGSAGNLGTQTCPSLPATYPPVISVGGTTESGCVATYSFESEEIDLAAPGGGASRPGCPASSAERTIFQVAMIGRDPRSFGIEPSWSGTSMAAAHVSAGAAAVIASGVLRRGQRGPQRVAERLLSTARLPAFAQGEPASGFGAGILDLGRATNRSAGT